MRAIGGNNIARYDSLGTIYSFGSKIKELRKECGWSQRELGLRIHVSESSVSMYERGENEPNIAVLKAMAREFGVTVDELVGHETWGYLSIPDRNCLKQIEKVFLEYHSK